MADPAIDSQHHDIATCRQPSTSSRRQPLPPMPMPVTKKSSRGGTIALLVAAFIAAAGLAFAAGRLTAPAAAASSNSGPTGGFRFGPGRSLAPGQTFPTGGQFGGGRAFGGRTDRARRGDGNCQRLDHGQDGRRNDAADSAEQQHDLPPGDEQLVVCRRGG